MTSLASFFISHESSAQNNHSINQQGQIGLNTINSARMDEPVTMRTGITNTTPYTTSFIGLQIAKPLGISVRQNTLRKSIGARADKLYPALDFKLRLLEETAQLPAIAIGAESFIGYRHTAKNYITTSKRYKNFDFTFGAGYFDNSQPQNETMASGPGNWFSDKKSFFFGGFEYNTPLNGLNLKVDYNSDTSFIQDAKSLNINTPAQWAIGVSYTPKSWISGQIGLHGKDTLMARLSLQKNVNSLVLPKQRNNNNSQPAPEEPDLYAQHSLPWIINNKKDALVALNKNKDTITITPRNFNFRGPSLTLLRQDLEKLTHPATTSAEEIWQHTRIDTQKSSEAHPPMTNKTAHFMLLLNQTLSLSEEDHAALYRSSITASYKKTYFLRSFHHGNALKINLFNNLDKLNATRGAENIIGRSDESAFADKRIILENSYIGLTHSFSPALHAAISAGYLEEMYGGLGGQILYAPPDSRFSVGTEIWSALKRDPSTLLALGYNDKTLSGHFDFRYIFPTEDLTVHLRMGRYLAGDIGFSLGAEKTLKNGISFSAQSTWTNAQDHNVYDQNKQAMHSINFKIPLGGIKHAPKNSFMVTTLRPIARAYGQNISPPIDIYEQTKAFSVSEISKNWYDLKPQE